MQKRFPMVAKILAPSFRELAGRLGCTPRQASLAVAHELALSLDAVYSWQAGTRGVPTRKIDALVTALGHTTPAGTPNARGKRLSASLRRARKLGLLRRSWKEQVGERDIVLRVDEARYVGAGKFLGRVFSEFLDAAGVKHEPARSGRAGRRHFDELREDVWRGALDVALGVLCTPRFSLTLFSFPTPLRYRLNAVVLAADADRLGGVDRIARLFAGRRARTRNDTLLPLAMPGEVGYIHARRRLRFKRVHRVGSLSATKFCEALSSKAARSPGRVPIVIVDEVTCFSILIALEGRGRLVFPLNPDPAQTRVPILPSFPLGICVSRNETVLHAKKGELALFLRDALSEYILGNSASIAHAYLALRDQISRLAERAVPDCGNEERARWLSRTFRLRDELNLWTLEPPHWRAVLVEAMSLDARRML